MSDLYQRPGNEPRFLLANRWRSEGGGKPSVQYHIMSRVKLQQMLYPKDVAEYRYQDIVVKPMSLLLGAEVDNVDLKANLTDLQEIEILQALHQYKVCFFRGQNISARRQVELVKIFSDKLGITSDSEQKKKSSKDGIFVHPFLPQKKGQENIWPVGSSVGYATTGRPLRSVSDKSVDSPRVDRGTGSWLRPPYSGTSANVWHADNTFLREPSSFTILQAKRLPEFGGDTCFADMGQAYADLSAEVKMKLRGLRVVHDWRQAFPYFKRTCTLDEYRSLEKLYPPVLHPVVRKHPVTGQNVLYVNRAFSTRLENGDRNMFNFLADKASVPEYQIRFKWQNVGDIAMWDNRVLQHYAVNDYIGEQRLMEHTASLGEKPIFGN